MTTRFPSAEMPDIAGNRRPEEAPSAFRRPPKSAKPPERKSHSARNSAGIPLEAICIDAGKRLQFASIAQC